MQVANNYKQQLPLQCCLTTGKMAPDSIPKITI